MISHKFDHIAITYMYLFNYICIKFLASYQIVASVIGLLRVLQFNKFKFIGNNWQSISVFLGEYYLQIYLYKYIPTTSSVNLPPE